MEVHTVQPGPWMQTAALPSTAHIPTKMWPSLNKMNFTDGANIPKAVEQHKWHKQFANFFKKEYPKLLTHDFKASTVKHWVVHNIETKPDEKKCKFKARPLPALKEQSGKKAWMMDGTTRCRHHQQVKVQLGNAITPATKTKWRLATMRRLLVP